MAFMIRADSDEDLFAARSGVNTCRRADGEPLNQGEAEFRARLSEPVPSLEVAEGLRVVT